MIAGGESTTVEFKRKAKSPEKLAKEFAAFANTKGGYLMIGVDDDGAIVGVPSEKYEMDIIEQACYFYIDPPITPEIEIMTVAGKDVVVVRIEQSSQKPHKLVIETSEDPQASTRVYIRLGEKSVIASREMTRLMRYLNPGNDEPLRLSIGEKEKRLFAFLEKNERATVKDFAKLVNISNRQSERLLIRLVRAGALQIVTDGSHDYFILI